MKQRLFAPSDTSIVLPESPIVEAVDPEVTYSENHSNAAPQLLDANGAAAVSDSDSADFDGGRLVDSQISATSDVNVFTEDEGARGDLGVRDQGTGAGQIGVTGQTVTYGGIAIGTITSDGQDGATW